METPVLEVEDLSISFTQYTHGTGRRELPVIKGLDLTIAPGEISAVVGSSGSGKSLLAHAILGLLPYNASCTGTIRYQGQALTAERLEELRGTEIVLVPQSVNFLDPLMKVGPQLARGKRDKGVKEKIRAVLARYGLARETEDLYPFELSGGMARRVLISSAVVEQPALVIADEPTPGLDGPSAKRILGHFRELADGGAAVLFITHDLELALTAADRVAVFYAGVTVEECPAADFGRQAHHPYSAALWRAMPDNGFTPIPGSQPYPGQEGEGCPFAPRCDRRTAACGGEIPLRRQGRDYIRCLQEGERP